MFFISKIRTTFIKLVLKLLIFLFLNEDFKSISPMMNRGDVILFRKLFYFRNLFKNLLLKFQKKKILL